MRSDIPPPSEAPKVWRISEALDQFQRGELTEDEYVSRAIEVATAHVRGRVSSAHFEMIREMLFEMLESDPVLVELKRRVLQKRS